MGQSIIEDDFTDFSHKKKDLKTINKIVYFISIIIIFEIVFILYKTTEIFL